MPPKKLTKLISIVKPPYGGFHAILAVMFDGGGGFRPRSVETLGFRRIFCVWDTLGVLRHCYAIIELWRNTKFCGIRLLHGQISAYVLRRYAKMSTCSK